MQVFSAELHLNKHANSKTNLTKLTKKTPNPPVYTALGCKQRSERRSEPMLFSQAHKRCRSMSTGLPLNSHTIYSNTPAEVEQFAPW